MANRTLGPAEPLGLDGGDPVIAENLTKRFGEFTAVDRVSFQIHPGEVFGWSSVTPTIRQRTAGATAVVDGLIVCINAEKLRQVCDEDHDLGYLVMRRLANVVAGRLLVTRLQLLDMFANPETKNV